MLHIVACIKQVPDTKIIKMNPKTNTMDRASAPAILNPYDAHAVEEAVRLKQRYGGIVSVVTMGPPPAVKAIRKCIEIGADEGYLITDRAFAGADTLATSYSLTKALEKIGKARPIDLIICGKMTIDGDTGQVGPGIARRLDIPPLTNVKKVVELNRDEGYAIVHRKLEDGYEVIRTTLPSLFSVEKEINEIPYSTLPNMLRAARYKPVVWSVDDLGEVDRTQLGLKGSPTIVAKVWPPEKPKGGEMLQGSAQEQVKRVLSILLEKKELFQRAGSGGAAGSGEAAVPVAAEGSAAEAEPSEPQAVAESQEAPSVTVEPVAPEVAIAPVVSETPVAPEAATAPVALETPAAPEAAIAAVVSETPVAPVEPEAATAPVALETPVALELAIAPVEPEAQKVAEVPVTPVTPVAAEAPKLPKGRKEPKTPKASKAPNAQAATGATESPKVPEAPDAETSLATSDEPVSAPKVMEVASEAPVTEAKEVNIGETEIVAQPVMDVQEVPDMQAAQVTSENTEPVPQVAVDVEPVSAAEAVAEASEESEAVSEAAEKSPDSAERSGESKPSTAMEEGGVR